MLDGKLSADDSFSAVDKVVEENTDEFEDDNIKPGLGAPRIAGFDLAPLGAALRLNGGGAAIAGINAASRAKRR